MKKEPFNFMSLTIIERQGELVVDSRLVAEALGIQHKYVLANIIKYKDKLEQLGFLAVNSQNPTQKGVRGRPARFAWLNENQATFVMTLSRNTDQVVEAKLKLVKAFSQAKQVIQETRLQSQPQQPNQLPVAMPTPEEIDYLKLRPWEKVELEGKQIDWAEVAQKSGFDRAMRAIKD
jgi:phage regulator Rha-like protein